jgi:H+/Cl- antiporter ClcA
VDLFARDRTFWRTVLFAAVIGTVAGAAALAFTTLVKAGTDLIWPDEIDYGFLGGEVWWIGITAAAGLLVGLMRWGLRVRTSRPAHWRRSRKRGWITARPSRPSRCLRSR